MDSLGIRRRVYPEQGTANPVGHQTAVVLHAMLHARPHGTRLSSVHPAGCEPLAGHSPILSLSCSSAKEEDENLPGLR